MSEQAGPAVAPALLARAAEGRRAGRVEPDRTHLRLHLPAPAPRVL